MPAELLFKQAFSVVNVDNKAFVVVDNNNNNNNNKAQLETTKLPQQQQQRRQATQHSGSVDERGTTSGVLCVGIDAVST